MITATERNLIEKMIDLGAGDGLIHLLCSSLSVKQMEEAVVMFDLHQKTYGKVTEEDMLKALLILTEPDKAF